MLSSHHSSCGHLFSVLLASGQWTGLRHEGMGQSSHKRSPRQVDLEQILVGWEVGLSNGLACEHANPELLCQEPLIDRDKHPPTKSLKPRDPEGTGQAEM